MIDGLDKLSDQERMELQMAIGRWKELREVKSNPEIAKSREKCRRFADFVREAWAVVEGAREFQWSFHIEALCDHLQALHENRLFANKFIANVPPRTSKSTIATVMFPCWVWTQNPNLSLVFASYSFDLSSDHAYKRRTILDSQWYRERWPEIVMRSDRSNLASMENTQHGGMYTTSIKGTTTGKGGDYRILDDPNSAEQMESEVERASVLRFVDVTWPTRVNNPLTDKMIVIQQRTHTQDVTGHLMAKWKDHEAFVHFCVPMEFDPDRKCVTPIWQDPRSQKGELLNPARFPQAWVDEKRRDLGPYFFAGQYDQSPYPLGGGILKATWFGKWEPSAKQPGYLSVLGGMYHFDPDNCYRFCTVDPAISDDEIGVKKLGDPDYTVIMSWVAVWTHIGAVACLMEMYRARMEGDDIIPFIKELHDRTHFAIIGVETIAFQKMLFQQAKKKGLPVREICTRAADDVIYRIDKDKVSRAMGITPFLSQGRLALPEGVPWRGEFDPEVVQFPNAPHDDVVDCLVYGVAIADKYKGNPLSAPAEPEDQKPPRHPEDRDLPQAGPNLLSQWESPGGGGLHNWDSPM